MLEGLDQIDWSKLRHAYGTAETTPDYIRLLLSPDEEERDKAHTHLMHSVHHQEAVESVTPAVVPFLVELARDEGTPDRAWILSYLDSLLETCNDIPGVHADWWQTSITMGTFRYEMDTYNNILAGLDLYTSLLTHEDDKIRGYTAAIVGRIPDCRYQSLGPLWRALQNEKDPEVLSAQMASIDQLFAHVNRFYDSPIDVPDRETVMRFIGGFLSHSEFDVRVSAAITLTNMTERPWGNKTIPPHGGTILVEALTNISTRVRGSYIIFDPVVTECIRSTNIQGMIGLLTQENLNDRAAHLIGRELLDRTFQRKGTTVHMGSFQRWSAYADQVLEPSETKYRLPKHHSQYTGGKLHLPDHRKAVETIVGCEPFWEHPTNLLSFFYGLPDDREQLRALLVED